MKKNNNQISELNHELSKYSGCHAKLCGCDLKELLQSLHNFTAPYIPEDCALINSPLNNSLVVSTDMIPLPVPNLYDAANIATLHAMSDIFVSGGQVQWILPIVCLAEDLQMEGAKALFRGIFNACHSVNASVVGGHTLISSEAMIGITAIGTVAKNDLISKRGATVGDKIYLSKPLGVGAAIRSYRQGISSETEIQDAIKTMRVSNYESAQIAKSCNANAMTDVTGFGLLGHLTEMLTDQQGVQLYLNKVPCLNIALNVLPRIPLIHAEENNFLYASERHEVHESLRDERILLDPQTNGGVLCTLNNKANTKIIEKNFHEIGIVTDCPIISQ